MTHHVVKEAYPTIAVLTFAGLLTLGWNLPIGILLLVLGIYVAYFFRKPIFTHVPLENKVYSPAWGKVTSIHPEAGQDPKEYKKICIFLNIFDVHLQVVPINGTVVSINYTEGQFLNALRPSSRHLNENNKIQILVNQSKHLIEVKQIAGAIARRILCWVKPEETLTAGDYFGMIKFGSRVDISLPPQARVLVREGQKVQGGITVIAELPECND